MNPLFLFVERSRAGSNSLLVDCALTYAKEMRISADFSRIQKTSSGKPFFPGAGGVHFSVSHTKGLWVCALHDRPVGLDAELIREGDYVHIGKRFFHPEDYAWLEGKPEAEFFKIWTAKESYVKYTGTGIDYAFSRFSVVAEGALKTGMGEAYFYFPPILPGYMTCVCTEGPALINPVYL